jgi:hypothetical protein
VNLSAFFMTAALCFLAGCAARTADQQIQHDDAHYSSALRSYLSDLKPGVSRKEVEDYFRARSISFGRGMTITLIDHRLLSICPTRTLLGFAKRRAPGRAARLMSISFSSSQGTDPYSGVGNIEADDTDTSGKYQYIENLRLLLGPVKSGQNQMSGNATNQEL